MKDSTRGAAEMTGAMLIAGTLGWCVVKSGQPVGDIVFWRCLFGAVTLFVVCAAMGLLRRGLMTWRQAGLAALGGVAIVANWLLLFAAYPKASISVVTAVYNTQPFMLVGLGAILFRERVTLAQLGWLALAFTGVVLIVQVKGGTGSDYLIGILLTLGAAFLYALAAIATKLLKGTPPHLIALIQVVVGVAMMLPFSHPARPMPAGAWAIMLTLGVVHTGVMYILLYSAIQKLPTSLVGALSFVYPVVAIIVDRLAFGHRLTVTQIVGAAAILLAALAMNQGWTFDKRAVAAPVIDKV